MCFDGLERPRLYRETRRTARKAHACCECRLPIRPGEAYLECFGVWDGDAATYRTCATCEWLRGRIADAERAAGCREHEARPAFGFLEEELDEGHDRAIGLVDLLAYHEGD